MTLSTGRNKLKGVAVEKGYESRQVVFLFLSALLLSSGHDETALLLRLVTEKSSFFNLYYRK